MDASTKNLCALLDGTNTLASQMEAGSTLTGFAEQQLQAALASVSGVHVINYDNAATLAGRLQPAFAFVWSFCSILQLANLSVKNFALAENPGTKFRT